MADWFQTMAGGTRGRLLALLRRSHLTVPEAAELLRLSDNAVRTHVAALQRDGMLEKAGVERATGGKPAVRYRLTMEAEELFPKAYAVVLVEVLRTFESREGKSAGARLLRDVAKRLVGDAPRGDPPEARVEEAAAVLGELGGDVEVEVEAGNRDGWVLRSYGCPLSAVVREHPEICALTEALVAQVTGLPVTGCCERKPRPRCRFRIRTEAG